MEIARKSIFAVIARKTVLILGAGAHVPYGFPTGRQLIKYTMSQQFNEESWDGRVSPLNRDVKEILLALRLIDLDDLFRRELLSSDQPSIDAFIEYRPRYKEIGKAHIALTLLPCEANSRNIRDVGRAPEWFELLWQKWSSLNPGDLKNGNLTFITFNYDRWLENKLRELYNANYGLNYVIADEIVDQIPLFHVFGSLGPFKGKSWDDKNVAFGQSLMAMHAPKIQSCIQNIAVIAEKKQQDIEKIKDRIKTAELIVFLGFGYHPSNISLLFDGLKLDGKMIYGSGYGLLDGEIRLAKQLFKKYYDDVNNWESKLDIRPFNCADALREFPVLLS